MEGMLQGVLVRLLHWANSDPPVTRRTEFYALKDRLLRRYGTFGGHVLQHIVKPCWGSRHYLSDYGEYANDDYEQIPCGPTCRRCGGTGIFDQRWIRLEVWRWRGFTFHKPDGDTRKRPDSDPATWIDGRIQHRDYGRLSREAALWLFLLTGSWWLFRREMVSGWACGRYVYPLCNVQRVAAWLHWRLRWRRCCWCGRRFPTWGSGWQICRPCRRRDREEVPF